MRGSFYPIWVQKQTKPQDASHSQNALKRVYFKVSEN